MAEETQAVSSPAEVADPFNGEHVSMSEFQKYRTEGELPERFKPAVAESAPADTLEETEKPEGESSEPAPDSEPDDKQELPQKLSPYEKRVKQLLAEKNQALAEKKELERQLAEKQGVKTDSSPAPAPTRSKPTINDKNPDGTPKYPEYEDVVEAISRWAAQEERATWQREQEQKEAKKAFDSQMSEVRARHDDADAVISPTIKTLNEAKLPPAVHEAVGTSPQFFDLCYELGSDPEKLEKFISLAQTDPRAAIKQVFAVEDRVGSQRSMARDEAGKFTSKAAPEPKKTSAPKPPSPVGGASSRAFDVSDESLSNEEWFRKRNQQIAAKKG